MSAATTGPGPWLLYWPVVVSNLVMCTAQPMRRAWLPPRIQFVQNLGIDPKLEIPSGNGRPITLFREGTVIDSIIA
jgi:hypothetical protein